MDLYRLSEIDTVSSSVGKIILYWGAIEAYLNGLVLVLLKPSNNPPPHTGVPVSFSRKVALLNKCFRDNPRMVGIRDEARILMGELKALHDKRNIIVHGHYQGIIPGDQHEIIAYHTGRAKRHSWRWHYFTDKEFASLANKMLEAEVAIESLVSKTHRLSV